MFQAKGVETAFQFQVVEHVAGGQVLLPVLAGDGVGFRVIAGLVGIVEITVELEHAEGVAQLPVGVELVGEFGTQGLGFIVDVIAVIKVSGAAAHIRRAPVDPGNATVWRAVVTAVFVLHQPVQLWSELPAH